MSDNRQQFGKTGEAIAVRFLRQRGYRILEQNYRTVLGEIDIIAKDRDTLVFVEVKARKSIRFGNPKAAVTVRKQRKLSMVALHYLKSTAQSRVKARFDVVAIRSADAVPKIELVKNAFELAYD
jgi:putative endonuclease